MGGRRLGRSRHEQLAQGLAGWKCGWPARMGAWRQGAHISDILIVPRAPSMAGWVPNPHGAPHGGGGAGQMLSTEGHRDGAARHACERLGAASSCGRAGGACM